MGFNNCDNCGGPISWDKQRRAALNTRLPLNHDGTIHMCGRGGNGMHQPQPQPQSQSQSQQKPANPIQKAVTDQDQKSKDIKAAQLERKLQHIELIKNLQWNTKMLAFKAEQDGGGSAAEILSSMGFEEFQEEQRESFMDEVV
jgi:hypothetical protein